MSQQRRDEPGAEETGGFAGKGYAPKLHWRTQEASKRVTV